MSPTAFTETPALLYYGCVLLLAGLTLFINWSSRRRRAGLRRAFTFLSGSLLLWLVTLFLEVRTGSSQAQLWLGRANFAAVVFAAHFVLGFVREVPLAPTIRPSAAGRWLWASSAALVVATLTTPLVSAAEQVVDGHAVTRYGPLFPLYLLYVVGCLAAAVVLAFRERQRTRDRHVRGQLTLIALGMLATGGIASVTNALLPYAAGDFRFCDAGVLSTLLFVLAVAYATFVHGLFDPRMLVRETLVFGMLLAFVLGGYSSAVFVLSQHLTDGAEKGTQFAVLVIAFSFDPLRRYLEEKTDELLFGERDEREERRRDRRGGRVHRRLGLALLFPWRRR